MKQQQSHQSQQQSLRRRTIFRPNDVMKVAVVLFISVEIYLLQIIHNEVPSPVRLSSSPSPSIGSTNEVETGGADEHNFYNVSDLSIINLQDEIQKGIEYAASIKNLDRKLVFVHIPKTAGTAIEEVGGLQAKVPWGSCLFNHKPKRRGGVCKYPPGQFEWPTKIGYWHLPTQVFPLLGVDPYRDADLFAVVRDSVDRLISEFYYICRKKVTKWWDAIECNVTNIHDPKYMNEWLQEKLHQIPKIGQQYGPKSLLYQNGHFTPQYDFLVADGGIRMVDYVLRIDNLNIEFPQLMKAYGMDVQLLTDKKNAARNDTHDLDATHISESTFHLFHQIYDNDLDMFKL